MKMVISKYQKSFSRFYRFLWLNGNCSGYRENGNGIGNAIRKWECFALFRSLSKITIGFTVVNLIFGKTNRRVHSWFDTYCSVAFYLCFCFDLLGCAFYVCKDLLEIISEILCRGTTSSLGRARATGGPKGWPGYAVAYPKPALSILMTSLVKL